MKVRMSFVSNSSSSSFLMYGTTVSTEDCLEGTGDIECESPPGYGVQYIGLSWSSVGDDETGRQFKERAKRTALAFLEEHDIDTKGLEFGTHAESWYG